MIYLISLSPAIDRYIYTNEFNYQARSEVTEIKSTFGGKAINVAKIVSQFSDDYQLITLSDAEHESFIKGELTNIKYHLLACEHVRVNHKINVGGSVSELNLAPYSLSAETKQAVNDYLLANVTSEDYVLFAGSINPDDLNYLVDLCKQVKTTKIALDVPNLTINEFKQIKPFVIKPNEDEIAALIGNQTIDLSNAADELLAAGVQNVIISLGAEGSYFKNASSTYRVSPIRGCVKNTVGAGDSFMGGFLSIYANEENYKKALRYGAASGSASAFSEFIAKRDFIECIYPTVEID